MPDTNLPPTWPDEIFSHLKRTGENSVLVAAPLTRRHFAAFLVAAGKDGLRVRRKSVFQVVVEQGHSETDEPVATGVDSVTHAKGRLSA